MLFNADDKLLLPRCHTVGHTASAECSVSSSCTGKGAGAGVGVGVQRSRENARCVGGPLGSLDRSKLDIREESSKGKPHEGMTRMERAES